MAQARVNWNDRKALRRYRSSIKRGVRAATIVIANDVTVQVNRGQKTRASGKKQRRVGLDPSRPGEPPKKVTARLQGGIDTQEPEVLVDRITGRAGTSVAYSRHLEFGTRKGLDARPHWRPALIRLRPVLSRIIARGGGRP